MTFQIWPLRMKGAGSFMCEVPICFIIIQCQIQDVKSPVDQKSWLAVSTPVRPRLTRTTSNQRTSTLFQSVYRPKFQGDESG